MKKIFVFLAILGFIVICFLAFTELNSPAKEVCSQQTYFGLRASEWISKNFTYCK